MLESAKPLGISTSRPRELPLAVMLRQLDWLLVIGIAALVGYGLWAVAGVTSHDVPGQPRYYLSKQELYAGAGAVLFFIAAALSPHLYRRYWRALYLVAILTLLLVPLQGVAKRGSRRWLQIGFFQFQPSEFAKLLVILALVGFLAERGRALRDPSTIVGVLILVAIPTALVFIQPDFGTALVYAAVTAAVLLLAGIRWLYLAALGLAALVGATLLLWVLPALGVPVLKPYQTQRLTGFIHPSFDPNGATYNVAQSKVALGAGGLHGRGATGSTQTTLGFLPGNPTDFIFASIGEEHGFVGLSILLGLYLFVVWRALRALGNAADGYGAVVVGGIVAALVFQVFVNVGMTMGVAPITGIPLPLVSVGGSSLIANMAALGVLVGIQMRGEGSRRRLR
ncbi:MAG: rod shape-determining protein RodA [Gaiellaceae bacterium]|jgi:rod shape determining protein RodA